MKDKKANYAGICGKIEHLDGMGATATITGGSEFERRVNNNYCKSNHRDYDRVMHDVHASIPHSIADTSSPSIVGF